MSEQPALPNTEVLKSARPAHATAFDEWYYGEPGHVDENTMWPSDVANRAFTAGWRAALKHLERHLGGPQ